MLPTDFRSARKASWRKGRTTDPRMRTTRLEMQERYVHNKEHSEIKLDNIKKRSPFQNEAALHGYSNVHGVQPFASQIMF